MVSSTIVSAFCYLRNTDTHTLTAVVEIFVFCIYQEQTFKKFNTVQLFQVVSTMCVPWTFTSAAVSAFLQISSKCISWISATSIISQGQLGRRTRGHFEEWKAFLCISFSCLYKVSWWTGKNTADEQTVLPGNGTCCHCQLGEKRDCLLCSILVLSHPEHCVHIWDTIEERNKIIREDPRED